MFALLIGVILLSILIFIFDRKIYRDIKFKNVAKQFPEKFPVPIFGNVLEFLFKGPEDILNLWTERFKKHGSTSVFWLFEALHIVSQDPKYFEAILSSQSHLKKNATYRFLVEWLGEGLLISYGKKWFSRRKIITPAFHFQILQEFVEIFKYQNQIFIKKLKRVENGKPFNICDYVTLMTLDILSLTAMNVELHSQSKESEYTKAVKE